MGQAFSKDGGVLAYSLSSGGSDWREVRFLSIDGASGTTQDLPDKLEHVKFSSMAWSHDNKCGDALSRCSQAVRPEADREATCRVKNTESVEDMCVSYALASSSFLHSLYGCVRQGAFSTSATCHK